MVKPSKFQRIEEGRVVDTASVFLQSLSETEYDKSATRQIINGSLSQLNYGQVAGTFVNSGNELEVYLFGNNYLTTYDQVWDSSQIGQWMAREYGRAVATENIKKIGYKILPEQLVKDADGRKIRFCGGEPAVNPDYIVDVAGLSHDGTLIIETNGTMSQLLINELGNKVDKYIVEIDSPDNEFFIKHHKSPIKNTLEGLSLISKTGIPIEIATILIPDENTDESTITRLLDLVSAYGVNSWILRKFTPSYRIMDKPETSLDQIETALNIASKMGFETTVD